MFYLFKLHEFKIKIHLKAVTIEYGEPPLKFLEECKKAVLFHKPSKGYIYGNKSKGTIELAFSKGFDERKKQVFRNIWTEYPILKEANDNKSVALKFFKSHYV